MVQPTATVCGASASSAAPTKAPASPEASTKAPATTSGLTSPDELSRPSSAASDRSEASFLPLTRLLAPQKPVAVQTGLSRKRSWTEGPAADVHKLLDDLERELQVIKIKQLCCSNTRQRSALNIEIDCVMAKFAAIKEHCEAKVAKLRKTN
ncbi:unnamed protein product [Bursaphelenchus okinawaensis]|uniref:Uncharacterized protein n=1 Tax=Bursaphelenchus okinawaensis TaxID=465554 RepID=A0A811LBD5_9BILA|nr:unnamed protein product [Bursaphelenchus okinawaensis]CAG9121208.1 unnamed protein product [Bursaphelenchus okinawaensis]